MITKHEALRPETQKAAEKAAQEPNADRLGAIQRKRRGAPTRRAARVGLSQVARYARSRAVQQVPGAALRQRERARAIVDSSSGGDEEVPGARADLTLPASLSLKGEGGAREHRTDLTLPASLSLKGEGGARARIGLRKDPRGAVGGNATRGRPMGARMSDDASARPTPIVRGGGDRCAQGEAGERPTPPSDSRRGVRLAAPARPQDARPEVPPAASALRPRGGLLLRSRSGSSSRATAPSTTTRSGPNGMRGARRSSRRGLRVVRLENARLNRETLREGILPFTCPLSLQGEGDRG